MDRWSRVVSSSGCRLGGALLLLLVALGVAVSPVTAQEADPADVSSIDAIIAATYDVISGLAGDRDWDRERSLFHPASRHMPTTRNAEGGSDVNAMDVEGFIASSRGFFAQSPFYEYEISRATQRFGDIAHVFSTYAWGTEKDGPVLGRGINSFQLLWDGTRWWIVSVYWAQESEGMPIPVEYLP